MLKYEDEPNDIATQRETTKLPNTTKSEAKSEEMGGQKIGWSFKGSCGLRLSLKLTGQQRRGQHFWLKDR